MRGTKSRSSPIFNTGRLSDTGHAVCAGWAPRPRPRADAGQRWMDDVRRALDGCDGLLDDRTYTPVRGSKLRGRFSLRKGGCRFASLPKGKSNANARRRACGAL